MFSMTPCVWVWVLAAASWAMFSHDDDASACHDVTSRTTHHATVPMPHRPTHVIVCCHHV